jgi:hypothetical protein
MGQSSYLMELQTASPNTVHLRVEHGPGPRQFPKRLSDNRKNILLSPSGGGKDEGEGVKWCEHPPHPLPSPPVGEKEPRREVVGQPVRGDFSRDGLSEQHWG